MLGYLGAIKLAPRSSKVNPRGPELGPDSASGGVLAAVRPLFRTKVAFDTGRGETSPNTTRIRGYSGGFEFETGGTGAHLGAHCRPRNAADWLPEARNSVQLSLLASLLLLAALCGSHAILLNHMGSKHELSTEKLQTPEESGVS
jgi:hypothetical protein